jgi:hypothetical protein
VRSRQFVCNDARVIRLLERFVPVVDEPGRYRDAERSRLEYQLVERVLGQTVYGRIAGAQGLYIITPSGRLIAGTTEHSNPDRVLAEMQRGLEAYARLPRTERLLPREPDPRTDRIAPRAADARPPEGGLVLRMVTRGLAEAGVGQDDTRHPSFYKLDRVWLTREQARAFLPATLRAGERTAVRGPGLAILARLHLGVFVQPNPPWNGEDVRHLQVDSEIVSVQGSAVKVRLTGQARYEANSPYNNRRYEPRLLGHAVYDSRQQRFESFELVAAGPHTLGTVGEDQRARGPRTIPLGVLFTLNGANSNDQAPPHHLAQYDWAARSSRGE